MLYTSLSKPLKQLTKTRTTHYIPKEPLSQELQAALAYLKIPSFAECPYADFTPCFWNFLQYKDQPRSGSFYDSNTDIAHMYFDNLEKSFLSGLNDLIACHVLLQPYDFKLLSVPQSTTRSKPATASTPSSSTPQLARSTPVKEDAVPASPTPEENREAKMLYSYDITLSFAGSDRPLVKEIAQLVKAAGYRVFYDEDYKAALWGEDLSVYLDKIYRLDARFCVIFISKAYAEREWTNHEHRSARARAVKEKGAGYILPVRLDDTELEGLPPTIGHIGHPQHDAQEIAELIIAKLQSVGVMPSTS